MAPLTAEEFGEATLEVEVSLDSGEVQWMRQGVLLHPGAKYSLKRKGRKHTLTVHKLAVADRGIYSCESLHDRTQAQLTVERECTQCLFCQCAVDLRLSTAFTQKKKPTPTQHTHTFSSPLKLSVPTLDSALWLNQCI